MVSIYPIERRLLTCLGGPTFFTGPCVTFCTGFFAACDCGFFFNACSRCLLNNCVRCHFNSFIFSSGICQMIGGRCAFSCFLRRDSSSCLPCGEETYCSMSFCFSAPERGVEERNCSGLALLAY